VKVKKAFLKESKTNVIQRAKSSKKFNEIIQKLNFYEKVLHGEDGNSMITKHPPIMKYIPKEETFIQLMMKAAGMKKQGDVDRKDSMLRRPSAME
jgi:hypothetical protein